MPNVQQQKWEIINNINNIHCLSILKQSTQSSKLHLSSLHVPYPFNEGYL